MNFHCCGSEAHLVIACLIVKLSIHGCLAGTRAWRGAEAGLNLKCASEHSQHFSANLYLFRFRIAYRFRLEWTRIPTELQRNKEFVLGLIAVHMQARRNSNFERLGCRAAPRNRNLFGRGDCQLILLRRTEQREAEGAQDAGP